VKDTRDARKEPLAEAAALKWVREQGVKSVIAARGRSVTRLDVKDAARTDLVKALVGPSGNLRAPAVRTGKVLLVGFSPEAWGEALG